MFYFCWLGFVLSVIWWIMKCYLTEGLNILFHSAGATWFFKTSWMIFNFIFVCYIFLCLLLFKIIIYLIWIVRNINHRNTNLKLWFILRFTNLIFKMSRKSTAIFLIWKLTCLHSSSYKWCKNNILFWLTRRVYITMTED